MNSIKNVITVVQYEDGAIAILQAAATWEEFKQSFSQSTAIINPESDYDGLNSNQYIGSNDESIKRLTSLLGLPNVNLEAKK